MITVQYFKTHRRVKYSQDDYDGDHHEEISHQLDAEDSRLTTKQRSTRKKTAVKEK